MSNILVIGGSGFAGSAIVKEAAKRGHQVVSLSRTLPAEQVAGVDYQAGSILDKAIRNAAVSAADVVIAAVSPRGAMAGKVAPLYIELAKEMAGTPKRLLLVGGFTSLRPAADQPRFFETEEIPEAYRAEALELIKIFETLHTDEHSATDWLFISPASLFGSYAQVADTGSYRKSGDVALLNEQGESKLSASDFALGLLDEIEQPAHHRENISIAQ